MAIAGGGEPRAPHRRTATTSRAGTPARPRRARATSWPRSARPATAFPEVVVFDVPARGAAAAPRTVTRLNDELAAELALVEPVERRWQSDGLRDPGLAAPRRARAPGRWCSRSTADPTRSTAGPRCSSGRSSRAPGSPSWPRNPRGSEGYGEAFNRANLGDWGDGPMADVVAGRGPGDRGRAGRSRPPGRHGRLVRRLPHELDHRQDATGSRPPSPAAPSSTCGCCSSPGTSRAASGRGSSSGATPGRTRTTSTRSRRCRWPRTCTRRC